MAEETVLGGIIQFFDKLGIYDVLLPFLLTFTIVFAILEKTKILGTEKIGGEEYPRKNANAMVAFSIGFFVVASAQVVEVITQVSSQVVILLMLAIFFLMLIGSFFPAEEFAKGESLKDQWPQIVFIVIMFVGIIYIFLSAIKTKTGISWWDYAWTWLGQYWSAPAVASIIMLLGVIWLMKYLMTEGEAKGEKGK